MNSGFPSFGSGTGFNTSSTNLFSNTQNANQSILRPTGTGSIFGSTTAAATTQPQQTSLFSSGGFGGFQAQNTSSVAQTQATGTTIKFSPPTGQDTMNKNGTAYTISTNHQCITAMKDYDSKSLEELRFEDYQANRKFPQAQSQFGGSTGLFSSSSTSNTSGFGSNLFGSSNTQSTTNRPLLFGSATTTTPATQTTSLFGQTTQASTVNKPFFGSGTTGTTGTTSGFSGFGSQTGTQSVFGQTQPAQQTGNIFSNIGQSTTTPSTGGLFGSSTASTGTTGGIFSQQANKPLFSTGSTGFGSSFGSTTTTAQPQAQQSPFSFNASTTTGTTTGQSLFGTTSQSPISAAKPFGSTGFGSLTGSTTTGFGTSGTTTTGGLFGSSTPQATQQKPAFGAATTTTTTGFGGFGSTATSATPASSNIFGGFGSTSTTGSTAQPQSGLLSNASPFGSTLGSQTSTGIFGSSTTGTGGLFGSTTTTATSGQTTTGGLFGSQPSTGFGGTTSLTGGFGSTGTQNQSLLNTSGLGGNLSGSGISGGLFGSSTATSTQPASQFGLGLGGTTGSTFGLGGTTGTTTSTGGFGSPFGNTASTGQTSTFGGGLNLTTGSLLQQQQQQQQSQQLQMQQLQQAAQSEQPLLQQQILALSNSPYGTSSLLRSNLTDMGKKEDIFKPVSPIAQRQYITEATSPIKLSSILSSSMGEIKGGLSQSIKITPKPLSSVSLNKKSDLFEGLDDEEVPCFYPRKNIKKLLFKPTIAGSSGGSATAEINTSRRSSTTSSLNGVENKIDFTRRSAFQEDAHLRYNSNGVMGSHGGNEYQISYSAAQITTDSTNVSEDGNQSDTNNLGGMSQPPHPANIILERPGYFTIPSMQDLASLTDAKGDCFAENFAIGRVDYGCITFPGTTNLANMNLDEIIHIRRKEVHVYPDESKKPPVGQGLNKPAEITLHRIWPVDKETKKPLTDPNRIINMGYNKKIEKATLEMNAQFIDYDPTTGSWTFKVKHFSKYGLHDSEDEDDADVSILNVPPSQQLKTSANVVHVAGKEEIDLKQEKEMIQKQLKLIESRRLELLQQRKNSIGTNLNSITNQQWEMLNEYATTSSAINNNIQTKSTTSYTENSHLHLELSSDSQEMAKNMDEIKEDEYEQNLATKKNIRKSYLLDNQDYETDDENIEDNVGDENKENSTSLYPSLKEIKKLKTKQVKQKISKSTNKIYPNLNQYETGEMYEQRNFNMESEETDYYNKHDMYEEKFNKNEIPFMSASSTVAHQLRENRNLIKAFFDDDQDSDTADYMNMVEDDTKIKMTDLIKKTQNFGIIKKAGLGGLSNEEIMESKLMIRKDLSLMGHSQQQPKQAKITTMSLTVADVQQRCGVKVLKPKLWDRFPIQKSVKLGFNKLNELIGSETNMMDSPEQESRLHLIKENEKSNTQLSVVPFVKLVDSVTFKENFNFIADPYLLQARRIRINFSMNPTAFTYTKLSYDSKIDNVSLVNMISSSTIPLTNYFNTLETNINGIELLNAKLELIQQNTEKYLNIQYALTEFLHINSSEISRQASNLLNSNEKHRLPFVKPIPGNKLIHLLAGCTQDMRQNIVGDHPDADNIDHMKVVWNLCKNLWGDIPDNYKVDSNSDSISNYENEQIRKRLLSEWLSECSSHRIEKENKMLRFSKNKENYLSGIFSLLTGNRLLDACKLAVDNQDFRLALLLSQSCGGGNDTFRKMIKKQIKEWLLSGSERFLNLERLKFYVLMSGNLTLDLPNNNTQLVNVCENLDWKRQFALHLWYNCLPINSILDALNSFETSISNNICNKPLPPYLEDSVSTNLESSFNLTVNNTSNLKSPPTSLANSSLFRLSQLPPKEKKQTSNDYLFDTCFHLIKLYCDEKYSIAEIVDPLSHSSNQIDFRLSWHLAMSLLSLNYSFITNECLNSLHDSYATQLQSIGLWQWSIFILMHINDEFRRETCVRNYISKYVSSDSELNEKETFLIEKLQVPSEWIYDSKALRAKYEYMHENQLKLLLKAHKWNEAHSVLIDLLAPDFFINENFTKLNDYLIPLAKESHSINKWNIGGQIYFDYIKLNQMFVSLIDFTSNQESEEKMLSENILKELNDQIISLSSRVKEIKDLDFSVPKKQLVCLNISKLLLNLFNLLSEINSNEISSTEENQIEYMSVNTEQQLKILTKSNVEKALNLTESVPNHEIIKTMLMKQTKYTFDYLMPKRSF